MDNYSRVKEKKSGSLRVLRQSGQATIEFALVMLMFFSFFLFYFQLTLLFAFGNYMHYATYMSARAYQSAGQQPGEQRERAIDVMNSMIGVNGDIYRFISTGVGGGIPLGVDIEDGFQGLSWATGVRYTFKGKIFATPLGGTNSTNNTLTLTSESFLGTEPSAAECEGDMVSGALYDNGC